MVVNLIFLCGRRRRACGVSYWRRPTRCIKARTNCVDFARQVLEHRLAKPRGLVFKLLLL